MIKGLLKNKGFTLIELLIFMGIFSILMVALFQLLISVFDVQLESKSNSAVDQDSRFIVNKLTNDIKNATSVTTPSIGASGQTLVILSGPVTYTYTLNGNNLTITDSALGVTNRLNSVNSNITSLNFRRLSDTHSNVSTVTVSITLESVAIKRSGKVLKTVTFTVGTR